VTSETFQAEHSWKVGVNIFLSGIVDAGNLAVRISELLDESNPGFGEVTSQSSKSPTVPGTSIGFALRVWSYEEPDARTVAHHVAVHTLHTASESSTLARPFGWTMSLELIPEAN
jgi:hypothetical protein